MRPIFSALLAAPLFALVSCSQNGELQATHRATHKLQDLSRYGQPHFVNSDLRAQAREAAESAHQERELLANHMTTPSRIDFVPPTLPSGAISFDGSLLPPKIPGTTALVEVSGPLPE